MGRSPKFRPVKKGGSFHVYVPGQGFVDLGTPDETEANTKALGYADKYSRDKMTNDTIAELPQPTTPPKSAEVMRAWISSNSSQSSLGPSQPTGPHSSQGAQSPAVSPGQSSSQTYIAPSNAQASIESRVNQLMPEEKRKKLADLCSRLATRITILTAGATVRVFGRIPDPDVDKEEKEVLQEGLSMMLDEAFVEHPPKPWMVVFGAATGIAIGMYVTGTPIEKKKVKPPSSPLDFEIDEDSTIQPS